MQQSGLGIGMGVPDSLIPSGKSAGVTPPAFAYSDIAGLWLWREAQKEAYNDNDLMPTLTDWSGALNHGVQAIGAQQATFKTNQVNTKPIFDFSAGGRNYIKLPAFNVSVNPFTFFTVIKSVGTGARTTIMYFGGTVGNNGGAQILKDSADKFRLTHSQIGEIGASASNMSLLSYELWCMTWDATNLLIYRRGVLNATIPDTTVLDNTVSRIQDQMNSGGGEIGSHLVALSLCYNTVLTAPQRVQVETKAIADYAL